MSDNVLRTRTKVVTLEELHSWIVEAREIAMIPDEGAADIILLRGDDNDEIADIEVVRAKFLDVLNEINELDTTFHDKFDCR